MKFLLKSVAKITFASLILISTSCSTSSEEDKKNDEVTNPDIDNPAPNTSAIVVTNISPTSGSKGTLVTITGDGFSTEMFGNTVTLNGKPCQVYTYPTKTQIKIVIPKEVSSGKFKITVGTATAETSPFEYLLTSDIFTIYGSTKGDSNDGIGQFNSPLDIARDSDGNIYFSDRGNNKIKKIATSGIITTLAGSTQGDSNDGIGQLNGPHGIAVDATGNVYFTDFQNHKVKKISTSGIITTIAGSIQGDSNDGIGKLNQPSHLTVDKSGNVYVSEWGNLKIKKIAPTGEISTFYEGAKHELSGPRGICIDSENNIIFVDDNVIKKITQDKIVTVIAGTRYTEGDSNEGLGKFNSMSGLTIDAADNLYVADSRNSKIKKITPAGVITTYSGELILSNYNNTGRALLTPFGVVLDKEGNAYVTSGVGNCIKKIVFN